MNKLTDDEILNAGYWAGFFIDTIEDEETGEEVHGFIDEDGNVNNEVCFKFARAIEAAVIAKYEVTSYVNIC